MTEPDIGQPLWRAYRDTHYQVNAGTGAFILRVDRYSPELATLCRNSGASCAAFITAWNPASRAPDSGAENHRWQCALIAELEALGLPWLPGEGRSPDGAWREPSVLALGLDREPALVLGRAFGQNAIVHAGADAVPRLLPCHPGSGLYPDPARE